MAQDSLLKPTLHVEVCLNHASVTAKVCKEICKAVGERLHEDFMICKVGQSITDFDNIHHGHLIDGIEIVDYTGPRVNDACHSLEDLALDVQAYALHTESEPTIQRRSIRQSGAEEAPTTRILTLPNAALHDEWNSLVFDDALPARLLRYLVRMVTLMSQPDLNLSTFNWNRLCLLHGPPGSGKSTLCRALAQKLSIRLSNVLAKSIFIEINTNSLLSKYFGESGKLIGATFERIYDMAQDRNNLFCVVMDEIETLAGSRSKSTNGAECSDGLRATNQLLTVLDRLRNLPNVIVLCTSNLIEAIDPAFLDRVDIKQLIPSPSPAAIYKIFRSCLNELVRSSLVDATAAQVSSRETEPKPPSKAAHGPARPSKTTPAAGAQSSSPLSSPPRSSPILLSAATIPILPETMLFLPTSPDSPGSRVWRLAQKCQGFSGRTSRRLPILGLAMYTWGGECSLEDAVGALERAVEQEVLVAGSVDGRRGERTMENGDVGMSGV